MICNIPEELKTSIGIYCIHNIENNKYYVGQTGESFHKRMIRHQNALKNNTHANEYLQHAYNKYGSEAFEFNVIEVCNDINLLPELEEKYISEYRQKYECYNILSGGPTMAKENNPMYGRKQSEEHRIKNGLAHKGLNAGEKCNFYGKDHSGENNGFYGHKHSEESRKKMSESKKERYKGEKNPFYGKHHTKEALEKMKDNGKNCMRKVRCLETDVVYSSVKEAAFETGSCARSISAVCSGERKSANHLHWEYASLRGGKPLPTSA